MQVAPNLFAQPGLVPPGFQQPLGQPALPVAEQQNVQQNPAPNGEEEATKLEIIPTSTGESFVVVGASGNDEIKKKIKSLGGHYNHRMKGWVFNVSKQADVCRELGMVPNADLIDPSKVITVEFSQRVQWQGDMAVVEQKMKDLGLTKKSGKGNVYTGDLSKAPAFLKSFQFQ